MSFSGARATKNSADMFASQAGVGDDVNRPTSSINDVKAADRLDRDAADGRPAPII